MRQKVSQQAVNIRHGPNLTFQPGRQMCDIVNVSAIIFLSQIRRCASNGHLSLLTQLHRYGLQNVHHRWTGWDAKFAGYDVCFGSQQQVSGEKTHSLFVSFSFSPLVRSLAQTQCFSNCILSVWIRCVSPLFLPVRSVSTHVVSLL